MVIVVAASAKLWLTSVLALEAIGWATYDDRWFLERAGSILAGSWLGEYDHMTLIKGPGYPLWVALCGALRLPLLPAQQGLYALACVAAVWALAPVVRAPMARAAMFVVLLFNPMTYAWDIGTRAAREGIYPALALLVFATVAGVVLRPDAPFARRTVLAVLGGVAIAFFWFTREEGLWITPLLVAGVVAVIRQGRRGWALAAVAAAAFAATYGSVMIANGVRYGVFEVVEFKERSFLRAYASLVAVRAETPEAHLPVPREVRERVYAVSPAFAELGAHLEGPSGQHWASRGDLRDATFMWALREAVAAAGYYRRGPAAAREYYDRLSAEIDRARRARLLDARPARASLVPPILPGQWKEVARTWMHGLLRVPLFRDFGVARPYSQGSDAELRWFAAATGGRVAPRREQLTSARIVGWVIHVDGPLDIAIVRADGTAVPGARVKRLPSPDLYEHLKHRWKDFPPARHARFDISVPSGPAAMVLSLRGKEIDRIAIAPPLRGPVDAGVRMSIEKVDIQTTEPPLTRHDAIRLEVLRGIGRSYQLLFPPLFAIACVVFLTQLRRIDLATTLLAGGVLAAFAARVMILALIDVTSFSVFTPNYQAPSYPFMLLAGLWMAYAGFSAMRNRAPQHAE
jgi:hypothetical protein